MISAIVVAAGQSKRFKKNKVVEKFNGKCIIEFSIKKFLSINGVSQLIIMLSKDLENNKDIERLKKTYPKVEFNFIDSHSRSETVMASVKLTKNQLVAIHDGCRPFFDKKFAKELFEKVRNQHFDGGSLIRNIRSSLKHYNEHTIETVDRDRYFITQTPQIFKKKILNTAYESGKEYQDEVEMCFRVTNNILFSEGSRENIKITFRRDLELKYE